MTIQFFYRIDTLQIDAVYRDCKTSSPVFLDPSTYVEVNVTDPGYVVDRNHKVVLDAGGAVIGTHEFENPVQPEEPKVLEMSMHAGRITGFDAGVIRPLKARILQDGDTFDVDCFVTQDLVDAFLAGSLAVNDWVLIYFLDMDINRAIAQQKVFKTW